jgi:hypothetical protein
MVLAAQTQHRPRNGLCADAALQHGEDLFDERGGGGDWSAPFEAGHDRQRVEGAAVGLLHIDSQLQSIDSEGYYLLKPLHQPSPIRSPPLAHELPLVLRGELALETLLPAALVGQRLAPREGGVLL